MPYTPIHDRPPHYSSLSTPPRDFRPPSPRYADPDLDPNEAYPWTRQGQLMASTSSRPEHSENGHHGITSGYYPGEDEAGPSRKRLREDEEELLYGNGNGGSTEHAPPIIYSSIFQIAPRNPFTRTVGDFIMANCIGRQNVEVEIKLGMLMANAGGGQPAHRLRLPTLSEMIMSPDYQIGSFSSNMTKQQHASLNKLLNDVTSSSIHSQVPIRFSRARNEDSFHENATSGKVRVSRDMRTKEIIPNGCVRKSRIADMNVHSPAEAFDWRLSASTEEPCELPTTTPHMFREKDRACYKHQLVQVDLSVVRTRFTEDGKPTLSYELEIELLDVPALLAEGEAEARGEPNRFDEMLQSCLDSARMLIRNVG